MTQGMAVEAVQNARVSVAAEVRAEMARQRISQSRVRLALGLSQSAMSRRITGELPFDVGELAALAELLGVPPARFFPASGHSPPAPRDPALVTPALPETVSNNDYLRLLRVAA